MVKLYKGSIILIVTLVMVLTSCIKEMNITGDSLWQGVDLEGQYFEFAILHDAGSVALALNTDAAGPYPLVKLDSIEFFSDCVHRMSDEVSGICDFEIVFLGESNALLFVSNKDGIPIQRVWQTEILLADDPGYFERRANFLGIPMDTLSIETYRVNE